MPDFALFATGLLITLGVVAGCLKLGQAEAREAELRARQRPQR